MIRASITREYVEEILEKQDAWLRANFLKDLGPEFYGKSDVVIAKEAKKRGYKVTYDRPNTTHELRNENGTIISTFKIIIDYKID
jgi:hypothetical protein